MPLAVPTTGLPPAVRLLQLRSCVDDRATGTFCDWVYGTTGSRWLAESSNWLLVKPLRILAILAVAVLIRFLVHRAIRRVTTRAAEGTVPGVLAKGHDVGLLASPLLSERRKQRAETMSAVLRSISTVVIVSVALLMALQVVGLPIGPLLASAGIFGISVGLGAQSLVRDFFSGVFLILEDQYGVGDLIDTGLETTGTIEAVGLRVTRLRAEDGVVWYVRNGEILRLGNHSQGWSTGTVEVALATGADPARARDVAAETATALAGDPEWQAAFLDPPTVAEVEQQDGGPVTVRVAVRCPPSQLAGVQQELRRRVEAALGRSGVPVLPPAEAEPAPPTAPA